MSHLKGAAPPQLQQWLPWENAGPVQQIRRSKTPKSQVKIVGEKIYTQCR